MFWSNYFLDEHTRALALLPVYYDPFWVACSVFIAIGASFAAFYTSDVVARSGLANNSKFWIPYSAVLLGIGIWSMHFMGMLAMEIGCAVSYDPILTGLSILPGIAAAASALYLDRIEQQKSCIMAGVLLGIGIGAMHYSGMYAMHLEGMIRYDSLLFIESIVLSVAFGILAMCVKLKVNKFLNVNNTWLGPLLGGILLGSGTSGMHYTAMNSAFFIDHGPGNILATDIVDTQHLNIIVICLVVAAALISSSFVYMGIKFMKARLFADRILLSANEGFLYTNSNGVIQECNPEAERLLGLNRSSLLGSQLDVLFNDNFLWEATHSDKFETLWHAADGAELHLLVHASQLVSHHNELQNIVILLTDISQQKRFEKDLHEQRNTLEQQFNRETALRKTLWASSTLQRAIIQSAGVSVISTDVHGIINSFNPEAERLTGYSADEMIGKHSPGIFHLPDEVVSKAKELNIEPGFEVFIHGLDENSVNTGKWTYVSKYGEHTPVYLTVTQLIEQDGSISGYLGVARDISDMVLAENAMISAMQEAENAALVKSNFLANMSHEIRTPLHAITGLTHLLLKSPLTEKQRSNLNKIQNSSDHLLGIINDILDLSKIEAEGMTIERTNFDLYAMLNDVAELVRTKIKFKHLELVFDIDPAIAINLIGDPLRIRQILINLLSNAVKFTQQGEIQLIARLQAEVGNRLTVKFMVTDTGVGISRDQLNNVNFFNPFQQADASITRQFGGTGLGLAISKKLVNLMGGDIGVESELGKGSCFWFTLELEKGERSKPSWMPDPDYRGRRMLVVDDNEHARKITADILDSMTFRVDQVASGDQAVESILEAERVGPPFEAVFVDRHMPGVDGIETARRIRLLDLDTDPGICLLDYDNTEDKLSAEQSTLVDSVLLKPITASSLFDMIVNMFGSRMRHDSSDVQNMPELNSACQDSHPKLKGKRILLVEDNEINQEIATELLQEFGLEVDVADNGEVALDRLDKKTYDAVLMDMQMPVMDGLTATRAIRQRSDCQFLPIIAMTANAMPLDRVKCIDAGMSDYLAKPIDPALFHEKLLHWLSQDPAVLEPSSPLPPPAPIVESPGMLHIEGLDMAKGLSQMGGNRDFYLSMLSKFAGKQSDAVAHIRKAVLSGENSTAIRLAHTLKGLCGSLGAISLQHHAGLLERMLHEDETFEVLSDSLDKLEHEVKELIEELRRWLPDEPMLEKFAGSDMAKLSDVVEQLLALLSNDDAESHNVFTRNRVLFENAWPERYKAICQAVESFDFKQALLEIHAAIASAQKE